MLLAIAIVTQKSLRGIDVGTERGIRADCQNSVPNPDLSLFTSPGLQVIKSKRPASFSDRLCCRFSHVVARNGPYPRQTPTSLGQGSRSRHHRLEVVDELQLLVCRAARSLSVTASVARSKPLSWRLRWQPQSNDLRAIHGIDPGSFSCL